MPRRFASQVHLTVSRLLQSNFLAQKPAWYDPVLQYPPIPTPPRTPSTSRSTFDTISPNAPRLRLKRQLNVENDAWDRPKAEAIVYLEDRVRRQFFKDHPFEAFRARSLVENDLETAAEHEMTGEKWTRLIQRGRNPTPEDAIKYAINLHEHHAVPLSLAYKGAVREFRSLRAEHDFSNAFAAQEAEAYGAEFGPTELEKGHELERKSLESFLPQSQFSEQYTGSKLPWTPVWKLPGNPRPEETWSRGIEYQERAEKGVRPDYHPDFTPLAVAEPPRQPRTLQQPISASRSEDARRGKTSRPGSSRPESRGMQSRAMGAASRIAASR
ncbi:mitochondrial ribosomal small subunit component [Tulasnella sp. JGI-2019a]|nr:mitochondrial ribosomal small subunit component [Tulasnella sp. JGI-2019a]KAG9004164.1 mitochondrial ribosomal small subunit component [Tulasnella sp. JGI-2019a]KAG9031014.1 mitochondrial ribosomal small subunit component [Tulasnella sp. JGI-2019a]